METFTELKDFVNNPSFHEERQKCFNRLNLDKIDAPIVDLIKDLAELDYCFTIQSCYGHFIYSRQKNPHNIEPLPISNSITKVEYRIAYVALCIENSVLGRELFQNLKEIPSINPEYIQFGSATWFWDRQVNSYVVQVEPSRYLKQDKCILNYNEALSVEKIRNQFYIELKKLIQS